MFKAGVFLFIQSAATSLARHDNGMQYPSQVGVNSYIKIQLSFLAKDVSSITILRQTPLISCHMRFTSVVEVVINNNLQTL